VFCSNCVTIHHSHGDEESNLYRISNFSEANPENIKLALFLLQDSVSLIIRDGKSSGACSWCSSLVRCGTKLADCRRYTSWWPVISHPHQHMPMLLLQYQLNACNWWRQTKLYIRTTQPCIRPETLNRVPASAGVKAGKSPLQVTLCDPIWHVMSHNCEIISMNYYMCFIRQNYAYRQTSMT